MNKEKFIQFKDALGRQEYNHTAHDGENITISDNCAVHFSVGSFYQLIDLRWKVTKEFYLIVIDGKSYDGEGNEFNIDNYAVRV